ncbi:MAG TPA: peptide-binding protein [Spirochaetota bacterium]|nr:peptide-binding protein [Spirochaetota bacterium]HOH36793.1 peptide-binding protein [Spirochaetota bacterium]HPJ15064.1 peptide-binding protein [Spirochaetota bacterium]HPY03153.1 peptide-binding protein [Spirochaetota bacterium]HQA52562.1 peptide-binding protein [Spirochaetota bacterium]
MNKFYQCLICLLCLAMASACSNADRNPDDFVVQISADPDTMNPILSQDSISSSIASYMFDSLLDRDKDTLEMIPELAERYEISRDGLVYRYYLRKDAKWSDGSPFTADDVVFSFQTIMSPKTACAHLKVYYADIKSVKAVTPHIVEYVFSKRYFKALEVSSSMPVLSRKQFGDGADFNTHKENRLPMGTGPYLLKRWDTGRRLVLVRNPYYYGEKPPFSEIIFKIIPDNSIAFQLLKKGEVDIINLRPIQWKRQTDSEKFNKNFYKIKYFQPNYRYIAWNHKKDFFADKEMRKALTMLINRQQIIDKLLFGQAVEVTASFYVKGPDYDSSLQPYPYDPEKAKKIFESKGWKDTDGDGILDKNGKKFSFSFMYAAHSKMSERFATIMKEDFKKSGIEVGIERLEWGSFLKRVDERNFDALILGWSMPFESDLYQVWHSSQIKDGSNHISYSNPELDRLIETVRLELDYKKRTEIYRKIHRIMYEDQPYTFLFCEATLVVLSRRFDNVKVHKTGLDYREWVIRRD